MTASTALDFADFAHHYPNMSEAAARSRWEALVHFLDSIILDAFGEYGTQNAVGKGGDNDPTPPRLGIEWKEPLKKAFRRAANPAERNSP